MEHEMTEWSSWCQQSDRWDHRWCLLRQIGSEARQTMEHRSAQWSRGPRDVEQLLTESGMAAQMRSIARQTEETAFVFFFPLHWVIHLLN